MKAVVKYKFENHDLTYVKLTLNNKHVNQRDLYDGVEKIMIFNNKIHVEVEAVGSEWDLKIEVHKIDKDSGFKKIDSYPINSSFQSSTYYEKTHKIV